MIELVYMSQAQHLFSEKELEELLIVARRNNTKRGISGMLLYDGKGTFLQAIEGEKSQIDELFDIISQDPRHSMIQQLSYNTIVERSFGDWKMGFKRIGSNNDSTANSTIDTSSNTKQAESEEGYSNFYDGGLENASDSFAISMLNHFRHSSS